jgi:hypothetical protein
MGASSRPDVNVSWQGVRAQQPTGAPPGTTGWLPDGPGVQPGVTEAGVPRLGSVPTQAGPPQAPASLRFAAADPRDRFGHAGPVPGAGSDPGAVPTPLTWRPRTDGVAVAGFVLSLLLWPLGFVLSVVGLRRTGRPGVAGRGLAVAGLTLSLVGAVLSGLAASVLLPVYLQQARTAQQTQASAALVKTRAWVLDMQARNGGYPIALDSTAPSTEPVVVRLLADPAGGAPCLDASVGSTTLVATPQSGYQVAVGSCG